MKTKQKLFDVAIFLSLIAAGIFLIPSPSDKNTENFGISKQKNERTNNADSSPASDSSKQDRTQFLSRF